MSSKSQSDDFNRLAQTYMNFGAPSRQRFEASFAPDFSMENDPGYLDAMKQACRDAGSFFNARSISSRTI